MKWKGDVGWREGVGCMCCREEEREMTEAGNNRRASRNERQNCTNNEAEQEGIEY